MRVKVWNGDQSEYLGEGTFVGYATVYFIANLDGSITSCDNAEKKPEGIPEERIIESGNNPKIKLDNGRIVYGCQVWWQPAKKIGG
jgi:hypothetical protein